jgi:hypothetical protein
MIFSAPVDLRTSELDTRTRVAPCMVLALELRKEMMTTQRFLHGRRIWRSSTLIMCAAIATSGLGCGGDAEQEVILASDTGCTSLAAGAPWWNQPFAQQTSLFQVELDATPSASSIDAVVGLADGNAASFAQLAAAVRFNPGGTIDVRAGSTYRADATQPYVVGTHYHFRLEVDVRTHTYSVWLRDAGGDLAPLAHEYPFRTEQAGVGRLNVAAGKIDSAAGSLEVCGLTFQPTSPNGCLVAHAGDGFATTVVPDATVLGTVDFTATASGPNIDAVIGLSAGPPAGFSDLATSVRLGPSGVVDVRDGDVYRTDQALTYGTQARNFRVTADLTSHTYSVFQGGFSFADELARQYAFRTQQRAVSHLDRLSVIVDGTEGSVTICGLAANRSRGVVYSREGERAVVPLANNQALISDGATIVRVDAQGQPIAQLAAAGELAADAQGNVFVVRVGDGQLIFHAYDPSFAPRWTATQPVPPGVVIRAVSVAACGDVLAAVTLAQDPDVTVFRAAADGSVTSQTVHGGLVTLDGDQPIIAWSDNDTIRIARFTATGQTVWSRGFAGRADLTALTVDPDHNVLFGGELQTAIDFGGGALPLMSNPDAALNGFVVELSPAGNHVFSTKTGASWVGGIASNGTRVVVSSTEWTQFPHPRIELFDAAGRPIAGTGFDTSFGTDLGRGGRVVIGASGRVWWNLLTQWPVFPQWPYLLVLSE